MLDIWLYVYKTNLCICERSCVLSRSCNVMRVKTFTDLRDDDCAPRVYDRR